MAAELKKVVNQNLECPVCLNIFNEPKILSCSHTFCKGCLDSLLGYLPEELKLLCPVCRKETVVPDGEVSNLQTNLTVRALVEDVQTQVQMCSNCDQEDAAPAAVYCKDCSDYLCESCHKMHSKWAKFSSHSIAAAKDVSTGKVTLKRRGQCQKHPGEEEGCFCLDCNGYVCFRCSVLDHTQEGHKVLEAVAYEKEHKRKIEEMEAKAASKICDVKKYVASVTKQRQRLHNVQENICHDIDEAYEETARKLAERKEILKGIVEKRIKKFDSSLEEMEWQGDQQIAQIDAVCRLVKNGLKVPVQKEALRTHNTLFKEMEQLLTRVDPDEQKPKRTADEGEQLRFIRSQRGIEIGQVQGDSNWILHMESQLPLKNSMRGMTVSPANTVDIGCWTGGIVTFSTAGILQEIVLKDVEVCALQFTSDGGYVIRDFSNNISLYTLHCCKKLRVHFETLSDEEGGPGDLTVDKDGNILSSYRTTKAIQVFGPSGGKPIREIQCQGFEPQQIFAMSSRNAILVKSDGHTVRILDGHSGATLDSITNEGVDAYPAVCKDGTVIIAWVTYEEGRVSIVQYTGELKVIQKIITNFKITKPSRPWYYLQEFKTGEIAFCTPGKLYIFRETKD
ncbi:E3 ubiquitin/ISG15 ligase TRIM25-like [Lytechinus variegatus]|uniref:E3 ubiquitin/ISG15 ligase TRIM25-like n=1 Tax=Lytechinus variegatus TaxID=7654 RepID=UPI001BB1A92B|nr:E3 ubiquitin/ISG15 ligase TRIM25-like [Lytechinus variegatus]